MVYHMSISFDLPRNEAAGIRDRKAEIIDRMGGLGWAGAAHKYVGAGFGLSFHTVPPADVTEGRSNGDLITIAHNMLWVIKLELEAAGLIPMEIEVSTVVHAADGSPRNLYSRHSNLIERLRRYPQWQSD